MFALFVVCNSDGNFPTDALTVKQEKVDGLEVLPVRGTLAGKRRGQWVQTHVPLCLHAGLTGKCRSYLS